MSVHNKKPPGHIHKIREFELEKITLSDEFDILQIVGEGWFGKILLVEHRATDTEMVLKALPKPYVSLRDFYREFHYGLHLGVHRNIVTTYDVAFETAGFYVFTQEYAPLGDLTSNVADSGIGELHSKKVAKQIASALDYMHAKDIVHRDVKLDNVLIYKSDFSRVKLCDFGESYKAGSVVERRNEWLPYSPPEVLQIQPEGTYEAQPSHDVWQFAIVIFVCLTGCLPWQKASTDDPRYARYLAWQNINMMIPLRRTPKLFKLLTSKASRMFRKFLEPKPERRPKNLIELNRFLDDRWLAKGSEKDMAEFEPDELCPSMYSFHSSLEEKNRVLWSLAEQGIETTVDRREKKNRIKNWIESSVIMEDDEEEDSGSASASPSSSVSREPVPGHISSVRAENAAEKARQKTINTTIKDASQKHFDPRTGVIQQGPSEMGTIYRNQSLSNLSNSTTNAQSLNSSLLTLGSRNNLIMSEGNPYQSDFNIDKDKPIIDDESLRIRQQEHQKMVNEHLKKFAPSNYIYSSNNNNYSYSNIVSNTASTTSIANNNRSNNNNYNNFEFNSSSNGLSKTSLYHTLSDSNLTDTQDIDSNNLTNKKYYRNNTEMNKTMAEPISRTPKPIQRTKSDSLRKVLGFKNQKLPTASPITATSTLTIIDIDINNTTNNKLQHQQQQQSQTHQPQQYFTASTNYNSNNNNNNNNQKSNNNLIVNANNINHDNNNVSKYGLMSAFKSIATISVPEFNQENTTEEEQQFQNTQKSDNKYTTLNSSNNNNNNNNRNNNNNNNNNTRNNIKDNDYGSYDKVNIGTTTTTNTNIRANNGKYSMNNDRETLKTNNNENNNYQMKKQKNFPNTNDNNKSNNQNNKGSLTTATSAKQTTANTTTQTTQTQYYGARKKNYNENFSTTMKDTPYDRVKMNLNSNNNNNTRNNNAKK